MKRKLRILFVIIACLAAFYTLAGFVALPIILKSVAPKKLSEALHRPVSVSSIRMNPYTLSLEVKGFDIKDGNGNDPFVSFDRMFINLDLASVVKLGPVVDEFSLEKPSIHISRLSSTKFNFSDLMAGNKQADASSAEKPAAALIHFAISNVRIADGELTFWDAPVKKKHVFSPINLSLPFISNFKPYVDTFAMPTLQGRINNTDVTVKLETKPFADSLETIMNVTLSGISIPYYLAYAPGDLGFQVANGKMDIQSHVSFLQRKKVSEVTISGSAGLSDLEINDRQGATLLKLPQLTLELAQSRPMDKQVNVASILMKSAELSIRRDAVGKINLLSLGPQPPDSDKSKPEEKPSENTSQKPLQLKVEKIALTGCKVSFADQAADRASSKTHTSPVETVLDDMDLGITGYSNAPGAQVEFDLKSRLNNEAAVSAKGRAAVSPLFVDGGFDIKDVNLQWAQPYIPESIRLAIAGGLFSASGQAEVNTSPENKLTASVKGNASVRQFAAREKDRTEDLVAWETLSLENINLAYNPSHIDIGTVQLTKLNDRLIRDKDGKLNVQKIFASSNGPSPSKKETTEAKPAGKNPEPIPVTIGRINLKDIGILFTDRSIQPDFSARLTLSEAGLTGLASDGGKAADVFVKGNIDNHAPIDIKGKVNPFKDDVFLDITFDLSDLDLGPVSPYSGKYIGRTIEKGKLNLGLSYVIDQKNINGQNKLMLDQFILGQTVNSPEAANLPVGLAVALLKDRSGKINLNVPVSGRTDDPEYKPGGLLVTALENIITKAATSPFDLVSSLIGGGEELRYIEFGPGAGGLDESGIKKLDAVKTLLFERPGLKLDLTGFADSDKDRTALAVARLDEMIKELKSSALTQKGKGAAAPGDVTVTSEEYEQYLKELYVSQVQSNPEKSVTAKPLKDKTLTPDEIKAAVLDQIKITDDELRALAANRTEAVKAYLLTDGKVEPSRAFIKQGDPLSPQKIDNYSAGRVELGIE